MAILINDVTPYARYTATAGQTLFTVPFEFFNESDLIVLVNDVTLTYSPTPADETQYSVTGANQEGGGSITLGASGASLDDDVVIYRAIPIARSANYPETGPMAIASLNTEQAKHIGIMQQLQREADRGVLLPLGEAGFELPAAADRASKVLAFDANGDPLAADAATHLAPLGAFGVTLVANATAADARSDLGINSAAELAALAGSALVGFLQAGTGAVARTLQDKAREFVSVPDFYDDADGADDTPSFNRALATGKDVFVPAGAGHGASGVYIVDHATIPAAGNVTIYGEAGTVLRPPSGGPQNGLTAGVHGALIYCRSSAAGVKIENITIRDLTFYGRVEAEAFSEFDHLVSLNGVNNVLIENCVFKGFRGDGFYTGAGEQGGERYNSNISIRNCLFDGINKDNRNAISVITVDGIDISGCTFNNCTRTTMPGAIDFEPDNFSYYYIRGASISNCRFYNVGGNVGTIAVRIPASATVPSGISIDSCHFRDCTNGSDIFVTVERIVPTTADDMGITVTNCTGIGSTGGVYYLKSVRGFIAKGNSWSNYDSISRVGFTGADDYASNVSIQDSFIKCGSSFDNAMTLYDCDTVEIGGTFIDCTNAAANSAAVAFAGSSTSANIKLSFMVRSPTANQTKRAVRDDGHTFTRDTNLDLIDATIGMSDEFKSINRTLNTAAITLANGWVPYGDVTIQDVAVTKNSEGQVLLHGMIKNGTTTAGTIIGTLPAGYRPALNRYFPIITNGAAGGVRITTAGTITVLAINAAYASLDGIIFQAAP